MVASSLRAATITVTAGQVPAAQTPTGGSMLGGR